MLNKSKKLIFIIPVVLTLVLAMSLPLQSVFAINDIPTAVNGRILPANKAGDNSDWIEIAQNDGYSLIIRKDALQSSGFGSSPQYTNSTARTIVNTWFNNTLGSSARLRDFTVQSNALSQLGAWTSSNSGFSKPSVNAARTGNDVAFLLSFAEAAIFCSTQYASSSTNYTQSSSAAAANFNKLTPISGGQPTNHWWLRTAGNLGDRVCTVGLGGFNTWGSSAMNGAVNQYQMTSNIIKIRPALWVGSGIFDDPVTNTRTVTGLVWPMVSYDRGLGESFLRRHDVVVELRPTFRTPAAAGLSTKAVLMNASGLGQFTLENVPFGTYVLYIKRPGYLARAMMVSVSAADLPVKTLAPPGIADNNIFNLWWGDCNGDGRVDNEDILMVMELMNLKVNALSPLYNPACDLNAEGLIDNEDLLMVMEMWNRIVIDYPGTAGVDFSR